MILLNVKDFRTDSDYPVETSEEALGELLEEAGCPFQTPLSVRMRLKDLDARFILSKVEFVESVDSIRINVYLPSGEKPDQKYVDRLNFELRHYLKHVAQTRSYRDQGLREVGQDDIDADEAEAEEFARQSKLTTVTLP